MYVLITFVVSYPYYVLIFFKQETAYELRISDWSSDVCSSDLPCRLARAPVAAGFGRFVRGAEAAKLSSHPLHDRRDGGFASLFAATRRKRLRSRPARRRRHPLRPHRQPPCRGRTDWTRAV